MIIKLAIKTGLAYATFHYSKEAGIWGDAQQTEKVYNSIKNELCPYVSQVKKKVPMELPYLPSSGEVGFLIKHYYNQGVIGTMHFIHMAPCYVGRWTKKGVDTVKQALEAPPPSTDSIKLAK